MEAKALRTALVEREEAYGRAMSSADPAVLEAFLDRYPTGKPTKKLLHRLKWGRLLRPSRRWLIAASPLALLLVAGLWFFLPSLRYDGYYERNYQKSSSTAGTSFLRFYSDGRVVASDQIEHLSAETWPFRSQFTKVPIVNSISFVVDFGGPKAYYHGTIGHNSLSLKTAYDPNSSNPEHQEYNFVQYKFP
jgi:hypothetical protein